MVGRQKNETFGYMKDQLWAKIQGWDKKFLSRAGKEVLLKVVAQAVPSYAMSVFLLSDELCDDIERMMNSYWWGQKRNASVGSVGSVGNGCALRRNLGGWVSGIFRHSTWQTDLEVSY